MLNILRLLGFFVKEMETKYKQLFISEARSNAPLARGRTNAPVWSTPLTHGLSSGVGCCVLLSGPEASPAALEPLKIYAIVLPFKTPSFILHRAPETPNRSPVKNNPN